MLNQKLKNVFENVVDFDQSCSKAYFGKGKTIPMSFSGSRGDSLTNLKQALTEMKYLPSNTEEKCFEGFKRQSAAEQLLCCFSWRLM